MNRGEFLSNKTVERFVDWATPKLDVADSLKHEYHSRKNGCLWSCNSLFSAYKAYNWSFNCKMPDGSKRSGETFNESAIVLDELSGGLNRAIESNNPSETQNYCMSILEWGRVLKGNDVWIEENRDRLPEILISARKILCPATADINRLSGIKRMNSGFSKIYSLIIDDYIIYDSRVGAALCLLIREYCRESNLPSIPSHLKFAYGAARTYKNQNNQPNRRDPSERPYIFPKLYPQNPESYARHNIKASWLLKALLENKKSRFSECKNPLRALEASLFMIGYDVRGGI